MKILFEHKMEQLDALIAEVKAFEISLRRDKIIFHILIGVNLGLMFWLSSLIFRRL